MNSLLRKLNFNVVYTASKQYLWNSQRMYAVDATAAAKASFLDRNTVIERVVSVVKKHEKVDPNKVSPTAHFNKDLGIDSLDSTEIVMEIENEFAIEIPDEEAFKLQSIEDVVNYVAQNPAAK